ncbi:MAG: hypothetical protein WA395_16175 [Nitrososphaeraceae archaeon]
MAYDRVKYIPTVKRIADELWNEINLTLSPEKTKEYHQMSGSIS